MIKVDSIQIEEFRGIRNLRLEFKNQTFAVCGPNGTGKSGVVDAVEFGLTGNISRLTGAGKGEVSLKEHGPHVDFRNKPEAARVIIWVTIPSLEKSVTIERSVKTPNLPKISSQEPEVLAVLANVAAHPEIVLSRRELIRYILATPGERAREVQALLRLDRIENVRLGLQKIANATERSLPTLALAVKTAAENLLKALGVGEMTSEKILMASNAQRAILGLPVIAEMTSRTSLKDGMVAPTAAKPQAISKAQAKADIAAVREQLHQYRGVAFAAKIVEVLSDIRRLAADPAAALGATSENFYATGLRLVQDETCPLCDTEWDPADLKIKIQGKLDRLQEFAGRRKAIERQMVLLTTPMNRLASALEVLVRHATLAVPPLPLDEAAAFAEACRAGARQLGELMPLASTEATLASMGADPQKTRVAVAELEKVVNALPEPTKQEAARDFLTLAQERLDVWREAKRKSKAATESAIRARKISDVYAAASDQILAGLFREVQKDFAGLYRAINYSDEKEFTAKLEPSIGKLGFDVDFYGRGHFPPGAFHSEGHQDGMGLCLYLALMRYLQGANFTFAVLDDVLMSVDTGHRREVCTLLRQQFPGTQFVMTTHDPVWLRQMKTVGLIGARNGIQFRKWSVDAGPADWDDRDVWTELDAHLEKNEVREAAALLRHFLEFSGGELCHRLRVPVEYRYDGQYQLGELLPPAIVQLRKLFKIAKDTAGSWNQKDLVEELGKREAAFVQLAETSRAEQWAINDAVHFNAWENMKKQDFHPVVTAYRNLLGGFGCTQCAGLLQLVPEREKAEFLRCDCGHTAINLKRKA